MNILISGGGTGGHIYPAIAVAEELKNIDQSINILFVGAKGRMEMRKVPEAGFAIEGLWISGLQRRLTWTNVLFPFKVINSLWNAYNLIRRFKPDIVAGFGGYASAAALYMAARMNIPTLIQEQNSYAGLTNKILAKRVNRICVAYEEAKRFFPIEKTILTGNPVRNLANIRHSSSEAKELLGFDPSASVVLVVGGSLGAASFNNAIKDAYDFLKENTHIQILWQTGGGHYEHYKNCSTSSLTNVKTLAFIDDMGIAYAAADLVVARAGALTISEICLLGKAAILVPSPNVAEDHQMKNAKALEQQSAAILLTDSKVSECLMLLIEENVKNGDVLDAISKNAMKMSYQDATKVIASEILKLKN